MSFKSERDTKPLLNVVLVGYDILYMEKDGKHSNMFKISHPGCDMLWLYAENKEVAELWLKVSGSPLKITTGYGWLLTTLKEKSHQLWLSGQFVVLITLT